MIKYKVGSGIQTRLCSTLKCISTFIPLFLELILGNKHGDFGDVPSQLDSSLQLAHLHFCLQCGRALHRAHQHQLPCHTVWTLDREVAASLPSPQQGEAKCVTYWTQCWDPEHDTRSGQVGNDSQVMVGERVWGLRTGLVVDRTGVTFTAPGKGSENWGMSRWYSWYKCKKLCSIYGIKVWAHSCSTVPLKWLILG